jgi:hypothetical protein
MPRNQVGQHLGHDAEASSTTIGMLARLAAEHAMQAGIDINLLLRRADIPPSLLQDAGIRIAVRSQIQLTNLVAEATQDKLLGFHLARNFDLRELGAFYYLLASAEKLGSAIDYAVRYFSTHNEGIQLYRSPGALSINFEYVGGERHTDTHQIEFLVTCVLRLSRQLTGRELTPTYVGFIHHHDGDASEMERYFGCKLSFGAVGDRISFDPHEADLPVVSSDRFLNKFLAEYYAETASQQQSRQSPFRARVENVITSRLSNGTAAIGNVASDLGMSTRTLSRRLSAENTTFSRI